MLNLEQSGGATLSEGVSKNGNGIEAGNGVKARVLLADDHFLIAEALSMILAPHFDVVGVVTDGQLLLPTRSPSAAWPEVVLLDVDDAGPQRH